MKKEYTPSPLIKVKVLGHLGQRFGKLFKIRGRSIREILDGLFVNIPEIKQFIYDSELGYKIFDGFDPLNDEDQFANPLGTSTLIIAPVPVGSGGVGKIFLGVALIAAGFFTGGTTFFLLGAALILQGAADILSPTQKTPESDNERQASFLFDENFGNSGKFHPIPILYGYRKRQVRSQDVISSDIETHDIPVGA